MHTCYTTGLCLTRECSKIHNYNRSSWMRRSVCNIVSMSDTFSLQSAFQTLPFLVKPCLTLKHCTCEWYAQPAHSHKHTQNTSPTVEWHGKANHCFQQVFTLAKAEFAEMYTWSWPSCANCFQISNRSRLQMFEKPKHVSVLKYPSGLDDTVRKKMLHRYQYNQRLAFTVT